MRRLLLPLLTLLALLAVGDSASAATTRDAPCPAHVSCRTVTVPLDRSGVVPGHVALHVGIVRARHATRAPVLALAGGPGQASVQFTESFAQELASRGAHRDLITLDTRGTGWSGLVRCPGYERGFATSETASAGSCGRALGDRRAFYTSTDVAADIDAVRRRLGVPKIALYGVSYGTRVALEYARRYPAHTDRVILDSPLEPDGGDPFSLATLQAIPRVLHGICSYGCAGVPNPVAQMAKLAAELRAKPIRTTVRDGRSTIPFSFGADDLYTLLVTTDLFVPLMQALPPAVRYALQGNTGPLVGLARYAHELDALGTLRDFSPGLFAATLCEESPTAWDRTAAPDVRRGQALAALGTVPDAALGPFDRPAALAAGLLPTCGTWPAPLRAVSPDPPLPDVPFLILSGELDLRTPLEGARRLAAALPDATLVRQRAWGHDVLGAGPDSCASPAARRFLRGRTVRPSCGRVPDAQIPVSVQYGAGRPVVPLVAPF